MSVDTISALMQSLGFPALCCVGLFWFINKTMKEFTSEMRASMEKLSTSISANTTATTELCTTVETIVKMEEIHHGEG